MGESKRRQSALGDKYGQEENITLCDIPLVPLAFFILKIIYFYLSL